MNYLTFLVGAYLALSSADVPSLSSNFNVSEWHQFKDLHVKSYENSNIESIRRLLYFNNKNVVNKFHADAEEAEMFQLALNEYADMSQTEMAQRNGYILPTNEQTGLKETPKNSAEAQAFLDKILNDKSIEIPDQVDWRTVPGRVSEVKNQGQCGSCWAFATTGALEGQEKIRGLKGNATGLVELSEQNLVDCVTKDAGCQGGLMADAMDYIKTEGGIDDEKSYPYEAVTGKCRFKKNKVAFSDAGSAILPDGDEEKLKEVVAKFGPVAVAIDASSLWFQFYHRGVYVNKRCHNKQNELDHGVLIVGYGTDPKKGDYWIVKNSWGPKWGEKGYIRMARNRKNMCGIATAATIPTF